MENKSDNFDELCKNKYEEQLARVIHMEAIADRISDVLASDQDVKELLFGLKSEIEELTEYYDGPEWQEDFAAEQRGVFPNDIKRGILSEDMLYDLIGDVECLLGQGDGAFVIQEEGSSNKL